MTFFDTVINGLATGMGAAIGSYLSTKYVIDHTDKIRKKAYFFSNFLKRMAVFFRWSK